MFFKRHSQLCCSVGASIQHREGTEMEIILELSKRETDDDLNQLSLTFDAILEKMKKLRSNREANIHSLQGSYKVQIQKLREMRRKLKSVLDELEHNTVKEIFIGSGRSEYNVKLPSDTRESCNITGICVIRDGKIIISDYKNRNIKMLDQQYQEVSHYDLFSYPQAMCQVTDSEFAITCNLKDARSHTHEVRLFSVNGGQIVVGNIYKFQHSCIGIAHYRGELYVTSGTALYKYSLRSGKLVSQLYEDISGSLTVLKCAVNPKGDMIFVTNKDQHKLLTLTMDGSIISTFTDPILQECWDVHVTLEGHVLVCGWFSNNIVQLDSEGMNKLAVLALDGEKNPESICYNVNNDSIIVGQCDSNNILVFNLQ